LLAAAQFGNATAVRMAGEHLVAQFDVYHSDGVDLDIETELANQTQADLLLNVTQTVAGMVHRAKPGSQFTFAMSSLGNEELLAGSRYWPSISKGLSEACDFLVLMEYDMNTERYLPSVKNFTGGNTSTKATAALPYIKRSVDMYTALGVPASKLVIALPFFGSDFLCAPAASQPAGKVCEYVAGGNGDLAWGLSSDACQLSCAWEEAKPGVKAPTCLSYSHGDFWRYPGCTVCKVAGDPYNVVCHCDNPCPTASYLAQPGPGRGIQGAWEWDEWSATPFFRYTDVSKQLHEVWIDNSTSLALKSAFAGQVGARGVGVWSAGLLNYSRPDETAAFWQSFQAFRHRRTPHGA
jgi:spore germination protein YaaH